MYLPMRKKGVGRRVERIDGRRVIKESSKESPIVLLSFFFLFRCSSFLFPSSFLLLSSFGLATWFWKEEGKRRKSYWSIQREERMGDKLKPNFVGPRSKDASEMKVSFNVASSKSSKKRERSSKSPEKKVKKTKTVVEEPAEEFLDSFFPSEEAAPGESSNSGPEQFSFSVKIQHSTDETYVSLLLRSYPVLAAAGTWILPGFQDNKIDVIFSLS